MASQRPPKYGRAPVSTSFTPFEPLVCLSSTPDMPVTALAERVGWLGSTPSLRDNVRRLRPSGWGTVFGDQAVAAAIIDRIIHHADVFTL